MRFHSALGPTTHFWISQPTNNSCRLEVPRFSFGRESVVRPSSSLSGSPIDRRQPGEEALWRLQARNGFQAVHKSHQGTIALHFKSIYTHLVEERHHNQSIQHLRRFVEYAEANTDERLVRAQGLHELRVVERNPQVYGQGLQESTFPDRVRNPVFEAARRREEGTGVSC